jgi:hypothetical protein
MATLDVLKQAAKSNLNLIFTYEPTFFGQSDALPPVPGRNGGQGGRGAQAVSVSDPIYLAKKAFIEQNGLVVYRVADHWNSGEDLSVALGAVLGWNQGGIVFAGDPGVKRLAFAPLEFGAQDVEEAVGFEADQAD